MNIDFEKIKIIPAEKKNKTHKKGVWKVFNENLEFRLIASEPVSYIQHCKWWEAAFEKEYIYLILYELSIVGYIRLSKLRTKSKEINEISIALARKYHNSGIGSYSYKIFEKKMKEFGIKKIVALTDYKNKLAQNFFEKNKFEKKHIRFLKELEN
ncbi:MAG: GNAT family N-acetyltransferase [Candidatus Lokiarchaeia archaeon]